MAIENDKIKDLFSSKLGSFEPEVPTSVWGGLDQLLSNQPIQAPDPSSTTTSNAASTSSASSSTTTTTASVAGKASIIKTIAITVGLVAAVTTGILVVVTDERKPQQQEIATPAIVQKIEEVIEEPMDTLANTIVMPMAMLHKPAIAARMDKAAASALVVSANAEEVKDVEDAKEIKEGPPSASPMMAESVEADLLSLKSLGGFSIGASGNVGMLADNSTHRGGDVLFSRGDRSTAFNNVLKKENSDYKLKHKQPVTFGITVGKRLTPRLSIETGLVYTYLSSAITSNSIFRIEESQSFNYLGIPLSLNYTFYELGKTKFYIGVGGMVQKDIKGRYVSQMKFSLDDIENHGLGGDMFYEEPHSIKNSIKQSNPQFSARSTLGVSYPLYKKLYIYGTIGGAYYFDAENKYRTIYSDRKTQLDLNLGIKFDF